MPRESQRWVPVNSDRPLICCAAFLHVVVAGLWCHGVTCSESTCNVDDLLDSVTKSAVGTGAYCAWKDGTTVQVTFGRGESFMKPKEVFWHTGSRRRCRVALAFRAFHEEACCGTGAHRLGPGRVLERRFCSKPSGSWRSLVLPYEYNGILFPCRNVACIPAAENLQRGGGKVSVTAEIVSATECDTARRSSDVIPAREDAS